MNPADPLANLNPLRQPDLPGIWPPAPGWWVLAVLVLLVAAVALFLLVRRYRANAYRRTGLGQLRVLRDRYREEGNDREFLSAVNTLLKGVALRAFPARDIASTSGETWLQFLNRTLPSGPGFDPGFADAAYHREVPELDLGALGDTAARWIKHHRSTL